MRSKDALKNNLPKTEIRSKVKYAGNFLHDLDETLEYVSNYLDTELEKIFDIDYVDLGNRNIKIKVNDDQKFIYKMINIVVEHTSVDEKYGNIRFEITVTETSKKPRYYGVGKFVVNKKQEISSSLLKTLIGAIEEIYE